jgi:hypothetical protein
MSKNQCDGERRFEAGRPQSQVEESPESVSWGKAQTDIVKHGLAFMLWYVPVNSILMFLRLNRHFGGL